MEGEASSRPAALRNEQGAMLVRRSSKRELHILKNLLGAELEAMTRIQQVGALCADPGSDFESCLAKLLEAAVFITGAAKGNIQLFDEASTSLKIAAHLGLNEAFLAFFASVREEASSCGTAMRSGKRTVVEDVTECPLFAGTPSLEMLLAEGIRAVQSTPLQSSRGRLLGMISTHYDKPHRFTETELRRMDILARQAADFVERRRREEALSALAMERESLLEAEQAARIQAERAGRIKDDFVATLSHELRTPIQAVLGWAQVLQRKHEPGDLKIGLDTIVRNARAQAQLISDLLDMSRIVSGKLRLDVHQVDFPAIIEESIETVRPAAEAKEIRIHKNLPPLPGVATRGDPGRLQQVVWNLLNNAVKFTPHGGRIEVTLEKMDSHLELRVADTGVGIAPDFLPYVFERFRQEKTAVNRKQGGLGLGLAIVRSIMEAHGGSVCVQSAGENRGATFVVVLPVWASRQDDEAIPGHFGDARSSLLCDVNLSGVKVLVLDDESDARILVRRILEDAGARVSATESADETLLELKREVPDVLISDIGMPGKTGFDLIRAVRALPDREGGRVPAIALTAFARAEDRTRVMLSGYQVHVAKPVDAAELCAVVASLSGRARPHL